MKTVSIRDLRQRWPETERALQTENEILVTRDSRPVARLIRFVETRRPRLRFDPAAHAEWQRRANGGRVVRLVDKHLMADRDGRPAGPAGR